MSFAAEMRDFISGFEATSRIGDRISQRHLREAQINRLRSPTDSELGAQPDPFSNPAPQVHSGGGKTADSGSGPIKFAQQAYDYYRGKGLSDAHAKGIAANLAQESGGASNVISGDRYGDAGKSGYIGQWNGKRLNNLFAYAGTKQPTLEQQLDFVLEEGKPKSPYADAGAVKAAQVAASTDDPTQAVKAYRDFYERPSANDIKKRLKWMAGITGDGSTSVAAAPAASLKGVIPDPASDTTGGGDGGDGGDTQDPNSEDSTSPTDPVQVDPVDVSLGPAPQVEDNWGTFAARGGAIPAPHYAGGGTALAPKDPNGAPIFMQAGINPKGPDPYRDNGWRPRMIGDPTKGFPTYTGPTPSQLAFRTQATPETPPAAPVTTPATTTPTVQPIQIPGPISGHTPGMERGTGGGRPIPKLFNGMERVGGDPYRMTYNKQNYMFMGNDMWIPADEKWTPLYQNVGNAWLPIQQPVTNPTTPTQPTGSTLVNGQVVKPAHPYMARGGVIPEPTQAFEGGGGVDDTYTSSKSYYRPGERRSSNRYSARHDSEYWTPRKAAGKSKAGRTQGAPAAAGAKVRSAKQDVPLPQPRPADTGGAADVPIPQPRPGNNTPPIPMQGMFAATNTASAIPHGMAAPVLPDPGNPQTVQPHINVPPRQGPAPTERASKVTPETAPPVHERDFAATRQPPHLMPVFDNQGTVIGYTPSDQNGVRPDAMISPNLPPDGVPGVPGWMALEQASAGQAPPAFVPAQGLAPSAVDFQAGAIGARPAATPGAQVGLQQRIFGAPVYNGGYERGGVIPSYADGGRVEGGADNNPGYTSSRSYYAPGENPDTADDKVQPTPQLMDHVAQALDGGVKFLSQRFGLSQQGAVPDPATDGAMQQQNVKRFAAGEGAATPQEIKQVDDKIDPGRDLNEGDRQMTRLAKMTQWYLQQGRPKDAAAAAASLMQYGANRFSQLGAMAAAAYSDYQETGDKKDLQHTMKFLQSAYDMIPDGARVNVELKGDKLIGTRTTADGEDQTFEVSPDQLPQTIKTVMDKSAYWQQIFRLADPQGARQQASWAQQEAVRQDTRAYNEQQGLAKETRAEARARAREDRQAARADKRSAATRKEPVDYEKVSPLLAAAQKANAAATTGANDPATKAALDQSMSQLYDALPAGIDRATWIFKNTGIDRANWDYVSGQGGPTSGSVGAGGVTINGVKQPSGGAAPAQPGGEAPVANLPANIYKGDQPPANMPNAKRAKDGTWWMVTPGQKPMAIVVGQ